MFRENICDWKKIKDTSLWKHEMENMMVMNLQKYFMNMNWGQFARLFYNWNNDKEINSKKVDRCINRWIDANNTL